VLKFSFMLVLASNSPRRKDLLSLFGYPFIVRPAQIDESPLPGESPQQHVARLASEKALSVISAVDRGDFTVAQRSPLTVLAADTVVVDGDQILGKPIDESDARTMLYRLRGRSHQVFTALVVIRLPDDELSRNSFAETTGDLCKTTCDLCKTTCDLCKTTVTMRNYSSSEIVAYISSGDPLDKAGAYAIQHSDFHPVESLKGCYTNVIGLPLCRLVRLLPELVTDTDTKRPFTSTILSLPCIIGTGSSDMIDVSSDNQVSCSFLDYFEHAH
jgi:septum formation protein